MLKSEIIGFIKLKSIVEFKRIMMMSQRSSLLLFAWKVQPSSGGRPELKKISIKVVKLSLLIMIL